MRVFLQALGCRLNEAELERWSRDCHARGYMLAESAEHADLVVINTCAVTGESARKSRQLVRRAQRQNPNAKLVVSGCYASLEPEMAAAEQGVDLVVPNHDKDRLVALAAQQLDLPAMPALATAPDEQALWSRGRHRAFIKVQDGCRYRCAFCIVTRARGEERSRALDEIVDEVRRIHREGTLEVVLAGVHLGGYGSDSGSDLAELVRTVLAETDIPRVRLGSLEPWELGDGFWRLFEDPRLMPHLHLPIQSGADSVLRRMSRRCRTSEFRDLVAAGRTAVDGFNITTDVIVGFPGESDEEWQQTRLFVEEMAFGHVHVFAYSPRSGTKAASMSEQIAPAVKQARSRELHAIAAASRRATLEAAIGRTFDVLVEGREEREQNAFWSGYSPAYWRTEFEMPELPPNPTGSIISVRATAVSADGSRLEAQPVSETAGDNLR